jgi:cystathionine beta-lyase family protein involved in aluminum resistance
VIPGSTFIDGSTSELSADGSLREPYVVYGTHWTYVALALDTAVAAIQGISQN